MSKKLTSSIFSIFYPTKTKRVKFVSSDKNMKKTDSSKYSKSTRKNNTQNNAERNQAIRSQTDKIEYDTLPYHHISNRVKRYHTIKNYNTNNEDYNRKSKTRVYRIQNGITNIFKNIGKSGRKTFRKKTGIRTRG